MEIQFYDVSASQELACLNGQILSWNDLYLHCMETRSDSQDLVLSREDFCSMKFHPYGVESGGWKSWEDYFSTAVQLISGHVPSKEEIKMVREYIRRLPNSFKRSHVDQRFVLSFVSYLAIGFKSHTLSSFVSESNSIDDLCNFTLALCSSKEILFSSFFCSHRDPKTGESLNLLQSHVPGYKVARAVGLILGLAHNSKEQPRGQAIFLQQDASRYAASSIFPEVTVTYLEQGRGYEMLDRLKYQYELVGSVVQGLSGDRVKARLISLDVLSLRIEKFLTKHFGSNWRTKDYTSHEFKDNPIVQIAVDMALPDIERMMPFFQDEFQPEFMAKKEELLYLNQASAYEAGGQNMSKLITEVIEWFIEQHRMTISAKALYETVFYYLWGKYCGKFGNAFAVGLDRDHDGFQHFAWKLGISSEKRGDAGQQSAPLYARRNPNEQVHGALVDLSFRQFWR